MGLPGARLLIATIAAGLLALPAVAGAPEEPPGQAPPAAQGDAAATAGPVTVRFLEPGPRALLQGPTRIVIEALPPPPARIVSVSLYVDDHLLSILETAPYALTWDAGRAARGRRLRAVALDSEGRIGEAVLLARVVPIGQVEEVRLVNVYATVRDSRGRPVLDLDRGAFTITEDGVPQTVSHFNTARVPLTLALLIDASSSMRLGGKIDLARRGAEQLVEDVAPEDRILVLPFNDALLGEREPTADRSRIRERIRGIEPGGGTALYDAVHGAAGILQGVEGRRAIVLLSDGRDQALQENEPGSLHLFEEALERAHRADVAVYSIGLGRHLETELDLRRARSLKDILETLARETGGRSYFPERPGQLSEVYRQIAGDLKQQYALAYTSTNSVRDGRWRAIRVAVADKSLTVEARAGYYAPGPGLP
jgi:VWFA-related protein